MAQYKGLHWWQHVMLRYPVLLVIAFILMLEFGLYLILRFSYKSYELASGAFRYNRSLKKELHTAKEFATWSEAARKLDKEEQNDVWRADEECDLYDTEIIRDLKTQLIQCRTKNDVQGMMVILNAVFSNPNVGGIQNKLLYAHSHFGTKYLIEEFLQIVMESLILIRDSPQLELTKKLQFFRASCKAYGRTALLLSGGAAMGYFHLGVIKCLAEAHSLPKVLSGASAGSLIASFVATRTDAEILRDLTPDIYKHFTPTEESFFTKAGRYLREGHLFDYKLWIPKVKGLVGEYTFLEAFQRTGRILNIITTSTRKYTDCLMCNYKTTPNVTIWSAVLASSAMPTLLDAVELIEIDPDTKESAPFHYHGKRWRDGTIKMDLPRNMLQKQHNVQFLAVSQVNPHAMPFFFNTRGSYGVPTQGNQGGYRGGFIMAVCEKFLKYEMRKWLMLVSELDLLPNLFATDWRQIFTQDLTGSLNIVPRPKLRHYWNLLSDPTKETMPDYLWRGERATWAMLPRLLNRYRSEQIIQDSYAQLLRQQTEEKTNTDANDHKTTTITA